MKIKQEDIVNHLKHCGFVYQTSSIYGGIANGWDYGPLGTLLKQNIKKLWWDEYVTRTENSFGLDSNIILNPLTWKSSGHLSNFSDPLVDCKNCKNRFRVDKLISEKINIQAHESTPFEELERIIEENNICCPICGEKKWTKIRNFNLMFKTYLGTTENNNEMVFLRPETAQGIFTNFMNVVRTSRAKLPFSICQIGKAFRNEITPGNFIFRTREFEQMECECFTFPGFDTDEFENQLNKIKNFLFNILSINKSNIMMHEHKKDELSHYSKRTIDFQYNFPHGFSELWGLANRGDYDLKQHSKFANEEIYYFDEKQNKKIIPLVIEPSVGVERLFYAICCDKYDEEQLGDNEKRIVMHFPYNLSPYKVAVLPLVNKLKEKSLNIFKTIIKNNISAIFDSSGSIGRRYRRQDEIGTYFSITIDYETLNDEMVTIRHRDTMKQERIKIADIFTYLEKKKIING